MDELKKIFLAGVGITSTSIEKAEKLINEMVGKKGALRSRKEKNCRRS